MSRLFGVLVVLVAATSAAAQPGGGSCGISPPSGIEGGIPQCFNDVTNDVSIELGQAKFDCESPGVWDQSCATDRWCDFAHAVNQAYSDYLVCEYLGGPDCLTIYCNDLYAARADFFGAIDGCCVVGGTPRPETMNPLDAVILYNAIMAASRR
ncbi:MAG: hypothetical protein ACF8LL_02570 [Phycisphaerales bacterium]